MDQRDRYIGKEITTLLEHYIQRFYKRSHLERIYQLESTVSLELLVCLLFAALGTGTAPFIVTASSQTCGNGPQEATVIFMKWNIGFSWVGAVYLAALFIPNLIWARHKPEGYSEGGEPWALVLLERVGQVGTTVFVLFGDITFQGWNPWFVVSLLFLALYEAWWGRYFSGKPTLERMYGRFLGFPSPGAVLPVLSFCVLPSQPRNRFLSHVSASWVWGISEFI